MPSEELASIVALLRSDPLSRAPTLLAMRDKYESVASQATLPGDVERRPLTIGTIPAEWISISARPQRVLFFLHGGGYVLGSIATHRRLAADLARAADARVLAIDYRRAPESPYPAALEDALAAYRWLIETDVGAENIAFVGDSCGAGLGIAVMLRARDERLPLPSACVWFSPWVDLAMTGDSIRTCAAIDPCVTEKSLRDMARAYLGKIDPKTPLASPLYGELAGLPRTLIQVGTDEVLLDDARRLADKARAAGVPVELDVQSHMFHVWQAFAPQLPEGRGAIERAGEFIRATVRRG